MKKNEFLLKAVLSFDTTFKFYIRDGKIIWQDDRPQPTEEQIKAKITELEAQAKKDNAYTSLQTLCDTKSQEAKNYIAGKRVTAEQLARYKEKFEIAQEYKANGSYADVLKLEADLQGLSVDDLADLIIAKGQAYKQALIKFNAKIEAFRVLVADLIEAGEIDKAMSIIEKAKKLGVDTKDEDIKALFKW